ncbi:metallophosphoesterase family protein [Natronospora cellulosivora (SeqCode)]
MSLKIFHTGDLHIGMKFSNYPDFIRNELIESRFQTLEEMILTANQEQCNLFVIAGDLFDKINIPKKDIIRVISILTKFAGDCVLVMPGNHDYDNGMVELWERFHNNISSNILLLNEYRAYSLEDFDLDVMVYPAFCDSKHSDTNRLQWIKDLEELEDAKWQLGIAHGALSGLSPDLSSQYFNMSETELAETGMDLWLLGHTHIPYPALDEVKNRKVFNAGTHEPDGMDCKHSGTAWLIEIDQGKNTLAKRISTGKYRFYDLAYKIEKEKDLSDIKESLLDKDTDRKIVRISLSGVIDECLFKEKEDFYQQLRRKLAYLEIDDNNLRIRISEDLIDKEFTKDSFPHLVLKELAASKEEDALQLAYEMIKEVKE